MNLLALLRLMPNWSKYGVCVKCGALAQEKCHRRWAIKPCKDRETYSRYCHRYATILTEHHGYTVLAEQIPEIERTEINRNGKA